MGTTERSQAIEAASPFEMRVNQAAHVAETDIRSALVTGDMGFLHSFTTGSTVDGPGVRLVAWTAGCMWRCLYCHNPDTWTMTNGIPVTIAQAAEELKKYRVGLKIMSGGLTVNGGEPLMQASFLRQWLSQASLRVPVMLEPLDLRRQREDVLLGHEAAGDEDACQNDRGRPRLSARKLRPISLLIGATR
jgi:pyruvate formate lyase activating enzyme